MGKIEKTFRLDKTAFRAGKADDQAFQKNPYQNLTWQERLRIGHFLTSAAYDLPVDNWPPMDKSYFKRRKR